MDTIGKYKLVRVIGEGGMGQVYEALDPVIGRRVAIKTISLSVATDSETRARFFREAQAAGRLAHPNLITIHDIGDDNGTPYIVMELLEGMDLNAKIRQEQLSYDAKLQIMIDVCEGLSFAHGNGIIHRDIKPANIFVTTSGRAKILDFGLARGALSDVTQTGKIVGTPNYMSPEQIRGDDVDLRSDIFATGVVFYELLCGRKAFDGDSVANTLYKVLETHPQPIHALVEQLPPTLSNVIERALAKDRLARYQTSTEMLDALLKAHGRTTQLERTNLLTLPALRTPPPAAPRNRRPTAILGWALAGLAAVGLAVFALSSRRPLPDGPSSSVAPPVSGTAPRPAPQASVPDAAPPPPPRPVASAEAPSATVSDGGSKAPAPKASAAVRPRVEPEPPRPLVPTPPAAPAPEVRSAPALAPPAVTPPPAPEPKAAPAEVPPAPVPAPPPPAPTPAAAPTRTEENPVTAIQSVLTRYRAALESRDIGALKRIWPVLSGRQEDAIRNEFEHSQAIAVGLDAVDVRPSGNSATVTCRRNYSVTTATGQSLKTATTMFMTLSRRDGTWSIDTIRHEVAR